VSCEISVKTETVLTAMKETCRTMLAHILSHALHHMLNLSERAF